LTHSELARTVRARLGQDHRYAHTLRVARLGESLARAHGEDPSRAYVAGMLHDIARLYSSEQLLAACTERALAIDEFERENPVVLHSRVGAELAREAFAVTDEGVLSAIRAHTLGAPRMSPLDEIVYLADGLEPGRDFPERITYLEIAYRDLAEAMRLVLRSSIAYTRARGLTVAPQTDAALRRYDLMPRGESTLCRT
jgi:predicted HD superfamily hydrolase involved in NAD metabolism